MTLICTSTIFISVYCFKFHGVVTFIILSLRATLSAHKDLQNICTACIVDAAGGGSAAAAAAAVAVAAANANATAAAGRVLQTAASYLHHGIRRREVENN